MTAPNALLQSAFMLAQDLNTRGLQGWIQDNVIPLVLLGIAIMPSLDRRPRRQRRRRTP